MAADKFIRKQTVFNPESERQLKIWNWILTKTDNFKKQNYADFVREKLEWCMNNEGNYTLAPNQPTEVEVNEDNSSNTGWGSLL